MFHVCTLFPLGKDPEQPLRKGKIGNDVVIVVFLHAEHTSFNPGSITAKFPHTFVVVQPVGVSPVTGVAQKYRIALAHRRTVPYVCDPIITPGQAVWRPAKKCTVAVFNAYTLPTAIIISLLPALRV